jgi:8-oxo-dGTP pyrophosphatase MutT (NUDIX family)
MRDVTLCLIIKQETISSIILGMKKRGFGKGKFNGFGGKVDPKENIDHAAARELLEETDNTASEENIQKVISELEKVGVIDFHFHDVPQEDGWNQTVHVFVIKNFAFEINESEEMCPKAFSFDQIPYDQMWKDDIYWLPAVLKGMFVRAAFVFDKKGEEIIDFSIYARDRERR